MGKIKEFTKENKDVLVEVGFKSLLATGFLSLSFIFGILYGRTDGIKSGIDIGYTIGKEEGKNEILEKMLEVSKDQES